jgi:hypothetical protein
MAKHQEELAQEIWGPEDDDEESGEVWSGQQDVNSKLH